jgi:hypothetical protein
MTEYEICRKQKYLSFRCSSCGHEDSLWYDVCGHLRCRGCKGYLRQIKGIRGLPEASYSSVRLSPYYTEPIGSRLRRILKRVNKR